MVAPAKLGIAFVKSFFGHVQMCQGHSNVFFFCCFQYIFNAINLWQIDFVILLNF